MAFKTARRDTMAACRETVKYVKFTFESTEEGSALSSMTFSVKTDDALDALEKAAKIARALTGVQFKCKGVSVSGYSND
jgi:hypothetical protein